MSVARNSTIGIGANDEQGAVAMLLDQQSDASATLNGVRTIATGALRDQVVTADGKSVLVSDTSGTVTRYDLASGAATGSWHLSQSLGGMSVSPDGHYLYVVDETPMSVSGSSGSVTSVAAIYQVDLTSGAINTIAAQLPSGYGPTGLYDVAATADHLLLTEADGSTAVLSLDISTGSVTAGNSYIYPPAGLSSSPDGTHVLGWTSNSSDAPLITLDSQGNTLASHTNYADGVGGFLGVEAISADGSLVAQASNSDTLNTDLLIYNGNLKLQTAITGTTLDVIGHSAAAIVGLAFSPDGGTLYVLEAPTHEVFALSTANWSVEGVIPVAPFTAESNSRYAQDVDTGGFGDRLLVSSDGHTLTVQGDASLQAIDLTQTLPSPVLTTLSFPTAVTIGPDGGNLFITAGATDTSGTVESVTITLDHAIATVNGSTNQITFSAANDPFDDSYSAVNLALTGAASGTYAITAATVTDAAGHSVTYDADQLQALLPSTTFTVTADDNLTGGDDTFHDTYGQGLTVHGLAGNDTLYGSSTTDTLDGGAGDDTLVQGPGATTFIGGDGVDTVQLNGNAHDYYEVHPSDGNEIILLGRNGSAAETISEDVEHVRFADGTSFNYDNRPDSDYSDPGTVTGNYTINAPAEGYYTFNGGAGDNEVFLQGNVSDYTLSRGYFGDSSNFNSYESSPGNFDLTSKDGGAFYSFDESIDSIHFANGQYLSLKDLPAYVSGDASVAAGGEQNDILFQTKISGYEAFIGGGGHDDLYLNGNVSDYTMRDVYAVVEGAGTVSGIELIGNNGSGALFIDDTVNTIHFQNGQYLAFDDIASYVAPAVPATSDTVFHLLGDGVEFASVDGSAYANDVALINGNASDYSLQRDSGNGDFQLIRYDPVTGNPTSEIVLAENVETVQFGNGQYIALKDLPAYLTGNASFTGGTAGDDLLFVGSSGDQYVYGGSGQDNLYIHGNVQDYTLEQVTSMYDPQHGGSITGVELVADNGSGNIYIDQSVETVHFQNGQYLAFNDLSHYIG